MEIAKILVGATSGTARNRLRIPARAAGLTVSVIFTDPAWDNLTKTVVFRGTGSRISEFDGKTAVIPWEVLAEPGTRVYFGIYGTDPANDIALPLIEVDIGVTERSADPQADPGTDPTLPIWAQLQEDVEKLKQSGGGGDFVVDSEGNVNQGLTSEQITALHGMFKVCAFTKADVSAEYNAFKTAFGIEDSGEEEPDVPVIPPDEPDEPDTPEITLTSISATYSGGDVAVGTALTDLTGIVVTAKYSDGSTENVTGYTLSGEIAEGSNTITVSYGGKTTTFTVTGVAESGGDSDELMCASNIVLSNHTINKNATYKFYELEAREGCNVYEIPVEAGETYIVTLTHNSPYANQVRWRTSKLTDSSPDTDFAVSAEKFTDFTTIGSRVTVTLDGNATLDLTNAGTGVKNAEGTYDFCLTFTPAISGYFYAANHNTADKYSIKKVVA